MSSRTEADDLRRREVWKVLSDRRWYPAPLGAMAIAINLYVCINATTWSAARLYEPLGLLIVAYGVLQTITYYLTGFLTADRDDLSLPRVSEVHTAVVSAYWIITFSAVLQFNKTFVTFLAQASPQHNAILLTSVMALLIIYSLGRVLIALQSPSGTVAAPTLFYDGFDEYAVQALEYAQTQSHARGRSEIETTYILVGILSDYNGVASRFVRARGISQVQMQQRLDEDAPLASGTTDASVPPIFSTRSRTIIENALRRGERAQRAATSDDLFFEALKFSEVRQLLRAFHIDIAELKLIRT